MSKRRNRSGKARPVEDMAPGRKTSPARPMHWGEWLLLAGLTAVASWLFLTNLGDRYLWQDEAQTALIAKTVLTDGVPRGYDGKNYFSQEAGREYGRNYLYRWHTWFPFYLLAGFFGVLGTSTLVARLPFALLGLASVPVSFFLAHVLWQSRRAAVLAALALGTSIPFLLLSRQCRYYSPCALFSLLGLWAYCQMVRGTRWAAAAFVVAATLLFHSHFPCWGCLLAAVLVHAAIFHRERFAAVALWSFCTFLLNLPWLVWLLSPPAVGQFPGTTFSFIRSVGLAGQYLSQIFRHLFSPLLLVLLVVTVVVARIRMQRFPRLDQNTARAVALLLLFAAINVGTLCALTPFCFFRYLAPVVAVFCLLAAGILELALRVHWGLGIAGLAVILLFSPWQDYLYELTHHCAGPTEGIVTFLQQHGKPDDVVAITYGDLPVKFYTVMRVVGGLTGEDLTPALKADWVIIRHTVVSRTDHAVAEQLTANLRMHYYQRMELDYPDVAADNRESPDEHLYRTATGAPPVVVYRRIAP